MHRYTNLRCAFVSKVWTLPSLGPRHTQPRLLQMLLGGTSQRDRPFVSSARSQRTPRMARRHAVKAISNTPAFPPEDDRPSRFVTILQGQEGLRDYRGGQWGRLGQPPDGPPHVAPNAIMHDWRNEVAIGASKHTHRHGERWHSRSAIIARRSRFLCAQHGTLAPVPSMT